MLYRCSPYSYNVSWQEKNADTTNCLYNQTSPLLFFERRYFSWPVCERGRKPFSPKAPITDNNTGRTTTRANIYRIVHWSVVYMINSNATSIQTWPKPNSPVSARLSRKSISLETIRYRKTMVSKISIPTNIGSMLDHSLRFGRLDFVGVGIWGIAWDGEREDVWRLDL